MSTTPSTAAAGPPARRRTTQHVAPGVRPAVTAGTYDLYPAHPLPAGQVGRGFEELARVLAGHEVVVLDGLEGVFWEDLRAGLGGAGLPHRWLAVGEAMLPTEHVRALVEPSLGGDDPVFGRRFEGELLDFFDRERLAGLDRVTGPVVLYGPGAALAGCDGFQTYVDLPKNELQFRQRAGSAGNLGAAAPLDPRTAYKRSYFVDWPVLRDHQAVLLPRLDLIVDGQRPQDPTFLSGEHLRAGLRAMATSSFRARPWFEPGPWGGQWIRERVPGLAQDVPNYAWSFELISPENGIALESDGRLVEVSFDWLMAGEAERVLGESHPRFGREFPIRFDFLDTVRGGNLSVQCHPRPEYIRREFGESFTQDETYYILDREPGASVYLGFQEGVDPDELRRALEDSVRQAAPVDVERFVQKHPAERHDLFLIPHGTVHCSGTGSLVLEISATPYIFTFKMYDWLRLDLEGKPRPLNIGRALDNLDLELQGERARQELISRPRTLEEGEGWRVVHLPTHEKHFYDVRRLEFEHAIEQDTRGACHVLNLVEGSWVLVEAGGRTQRVNYAETFVVPAAAGRYRLVNEEPGEAKVVQAFVKPGRGPS